LELIVRLPNIDSVKKSSSTAPVEASAYCHVGKEGVLLQWPSYVQREGHIDADFGIFIKKWEDDYNLKSHKDPLSVDEVKWNGARMFLQLLPQLPIPLCFPKKRGGEMMMMKVSQTQVEVVNTPPTTHPQPGILAPSKQTKEPSKDTPLPNPKLFDEDVASDALDKAKVIQFGELPGVVDDGLQATASYYKEGVGELVERGQPSPLELQASTVDEEREWERNKEKEKQKKEDDLKKQVEFSQKQKDQKKKEKETEDLVDQNDPDLLVNYNLNNPYYTVQSDTPALILCLEVTRLAKLSDGERDVELKKEGLPPIAPPKKDKEFAYARSVEAAVAMNEGCAGASISTLVRLKLAPIHVAAGLPLVGEVLRYSSEMMKYYEFDQSDDVQKDVVADMEEEPSNADPQKQGNNKVDNKEEGSEEEENMDFLRKNEKDIVRRIKKKSSVLAKPKSIMVEPKTKAADFEVEKQNEMRKQAGLGFVRVLITQLLDELFSTPVTKGGAKFVFFFKKNKEKDFLIFNFYFFYFFFSF
jgi:hypothetical protein